MSYAADDRVGQLKLSIAQTLLPGLPPIDRHDYQIIVNDPPWEYSHRENDRSHRGRTPYPNMDDQAILDMPVGAIADSNAYLFLWTTVQHQRLAFDCLKKWGFEHKATHIWVKTTKGADLESDEPKIRYGIGHYGRNCAEFVLVGMKGTMPSFTQLDICDMPNVFYAPIAEHSRKPEVFWQRVNRVAAALGNPPRIELFARQPREGWDRWGAEANEAA